MKVFYLSIQYNVTQTFIASFFVSVFCFFLKRRTPFDRVFRCFLDCNYSGCTKKKKKKSERKRKANAGVVSPPRAVYGAWYLFITAGKYRQRTHTHSHTHTHSLTRPALDMQRACVNISDK